MAAWRTKWVREKRDIALRLGSGGCGGSYGEAAIILCAVLNAMAAEVWSGRGLDRKRFVELLKQFAPANLQATRVSVPLLIGYLRRSGKELEAGLLRDSFMNYCNSRVLTGEEIDRSEREILGVCNTLSTSELRKFSYANLLYEEIRSGYVHQYQPGERADSWPMTQKSNANISYVNVKLVIHIAEEVDKISKNIPLPQPSKWWVDVFCFRWNWSFPLNLLTIERRGGKRDGKTTTEVYG
ncbi:MAG: hypothetical protein JRI90_16480 [Deltaproteobacteria bacterium]|nr:hypothetical protein [Deltaproteobacteria bacterium]